ncbi:PD-(D/E)XK nuclease family protein [Jiulongibacter sediminis]|uniref:PD-(D/E)XK endonuclease-like domain-containing protein n=1 Tax=Jiulongibacter sediminis TaxID=1605367 RepID=A0A0P7BYD7_9BACT|nr:PD-(D/E)XK nuclease family protein [Jiulongibacter sediminis]KPM49514.1 hypothetical protein AFM12_02605 [Jiulongibacter sediminis]TBX26557.1 hypothetical protein TK44_02610 [Jiulongibacter sediminis]
MNSFLKTTAQQIFDQHTIKELKDLCVVLPSRRATFFFKKELSEFSETPFVSPHVYSIDDFVTELSGLQIADQVTLTFDLFELYKKHDESISFEEFITWGSTVLKDFDLIDQYLVPDVKALFNYMSEAEALSRWEPDSSRPIEATANTRSYFRLYEILGKVYYEFRQHLQNQKSAYRGMAYRLLAEDFEQIDIDDVEFSHFYFVGLNALSKSEEQIISRLVKSKKATCFWDTDQWFMNSTHQAGDVLRRYRNSQVFGKWNEPADLLRTAEREVNIFDSPFETLQSKLGSQFLGSESTVFVVPDENLIQPLLFSMGQDVADYNITMGLGMGQSKIAVLMNDHLAMHTEGAYLSADGVKFNHRYLLKLLNNPLVKAYEQIVYPIEKPYQSLSNFIIEKNKVFITGDEVTKKLASDKLFDLFCRAWKGKAQNIVVLQQKVLELLQDQLIQELDVMEKGFFMLYFSVLNRLVDEIKKHSEFNTDALKALLKELLKQHRVPFTGEPVAPLQIMSLLETRCLDFEHVVLFSFNEGVVPSSQKNNSLIPFEACKEYGIPVFSDQDSIMAYHFYRLMMRAKKVDIIYTSGGTSGVGGGKEKSRFVLQLLHKLAPENPKMKVSESKVDFVKDDIDENTEIIIEKDQELVQKITEYLTKRGISASALSTYYDCSLRFYYSKILGLSELDEVEETFGNDVFGNWIHYSIEKIAKEVILEKNLITDGLKPKVLAAIPRVLDSVFNEHFAGYSADRGINVVYRVMANQLLKTYYEKVLFEGNDNLIVASELKIKAPQQHEKLSYSLTGNIDSVEFENGVLKLIDFKTGTVKNAELNFSSKETFNEAFKSASKGKFRQMSIYKYLAYHELQKSGKLNGFSLSPSTPMEAGMYSFRDLSEFHQQNQIPLEDLKREVEKALSDFVDEITDSQIPFAQTDDLKKCEWCPFKEVCGR